MYAIREMIIEGHTIVAHSFNSDRTGTPAVLLHGDSTSLNVWTLAPPEIVLDRFRWHALSLPGHYPGRFPEGFRSQDLTADTIARILAEAMGRLEPDSKIILIGHSTGGFVALHMAALFPEMVHCVISIAGYAWGKCSGIFGALQWLACHGKAAETLAKMDYRIFFSSRFMFRTGLSVYASDRSHLYSYDALEEIIDLVYPDARKLDLDAMLSYLNRLPAFDIKDELDRISVPTLVLAGEKDPVVPASQSRFIAEKVPRCDLVLLEGAGHLPMAECPVPYNRAITAWLEKVV
jgi:pimeloyl-ACP methyl ester carboxylesterase